MSSKETVAEFLKRGGSIQIIPPRVASETLRTFSSRKIRSANTASAGKERAKRTEDKAARNID